ncbi:MAG: serine/threonine protein kinase [Oscillochloris sp.]|nr:serine/threonine protein kinase [Oscillochloris sp.]
MTDTAATPTSSPLLFGRYRVSESLGETRLAAVYSAFDERLRRRVLLHLLRKELIAQERMRRRFVEEVGVGARCSHQTLLEVFDSGEAGGRPFLVTEYVSGRSLHNLGPLTPDQALLYLRQVTGAIAACQSSVDTAHPTGQTHPAISSSNLLLVDDGRIKLVDSWLTPISDAPSEIAAYRAPELSEGRPASHAAAVYALGLLAFELLTGTRPLQGSDARSIALAHLNARIPALSQLRPALFLPALEVLIAKATARMPEQRYSDAQAFGGALDSVWRDLSADTQQLFPARAAVQSAPAQQYTAPMPAPAPLIPPPAARNPIAAMTGRLNRRPQQGPVDPAQVRRQAVNRGIAGWLVMIVLILSVAAGSYLAVTALTSRVSNLPQPPGLPTIEPVNEPWAWLQGLFGGDEAIYFVNINEGLNLRSVPDATDPDNLLSVVPNGTPVVALEGPVEAGGIPWMRVRVERNGQLLEGWMSLNYLRRE